MKKRMIVFVLIAAILFSLTGCGTGPGFGAVTGKSDSASLAEGGAESHMNIGFITIAYTDEFCSLLAKTIRLKAEKLGYTVTLADGENDLQTQLDLINTFIVRGVDVIILQAVDSAGIYPGVKAANEAGIPVICTEVMPADGDFTYCGPISYDAGYMQGKKLCELYPEGCNVLYLQGTSGMIHTLQRREGFETAVNELGNDIHILDVQDADYVKDEGMRITEAWIQKYADPDSPTGVSFQAIVAGNDQMALGAMEALKTAGIPNGTITLMGIDGTAPCIQAIADGMMTCTIYQSSDHVADVTIDCLKLLAEGKKPEHEYFVSWEMIDGENYEMYQSS